MKIKAILFIYGTGGHKEQMKRLIEKLHIDTSKYKLISLIEENSNLNIFDEYIEIPPARDKYSHLKSLITAPYFILFSIFVLVKIFLKYDIKMLISTGPGIAIIPSIIFRLLGKKVLFIETWSRFYTKSMTGKIMYKIANIFYVQNKSLQELYPKSTYSGRL